MSMSANGVPQLCKTKEQEVSVFEFGSNIRFPLIQPFHRSLPIRHAIYLALRLPLKKRRDIASAILYAMGDANRILN